MISLSWLQIVSQQTLECHDFLLCVPTEDEIGAAIRSLKNGKAPGGDEITAELLKLGGGEVVQSLAHLAATLVWESETVPADWSKQLTIPLHKKGPTKDCDNYSGIVLLSIPGKVFCRVIQMMDCTLDREVNMCISKATRTFGSLYRVLWSRTNIKTSAKMCLFNSVVLSTLL